MEKMTEVKNITKPKESSAITIVICSWMTPIIGLIMLVVGLFGGYYGRPLMKSDSSEIAVSETVSPPQVYQQENNSNQELMDYLIAQTRHFAGDPKAPVTMIEFGDFQ